MPRHGGAVISTPYPDCLAAAVAAFNTASSQNRNEPGAAARHPLSDITLETRLRILRDLAVHLTCPGRSPAGPR